MHPTRWLWSTAAAWLAVVSLAQNSALAQRPDTATPVREAMKKLARLEGRWEGEATVSLGPGQRHQVKQTEIVRSKLDGTVLLIEGTGREASQGGEDQVVFRALAVATYDPTSQSYKFHAFHDGRSTVATAELTDSGIIWGFEDGRGGKVRYTITLAGDTWTEVGEYLRDGQPPMKFIEMKVKRVGDVDPEPAGR